jgi:hypothetical protein
MKFTRSIKRIYKGDIGNSCPCSAITRVFNEVDHFMKENKKDYEGAFKEKVYNSITK